MFLRLKVAQTFRSACAACSRPEGLRYQRRAIVNYQRRAIVNYQRRAIVNTGELRG
jgi:hypothetical protein